jgi:hypothetical protein
MARGVGPTTVEWAVRVDVAHPKRSERAGDIMTHLSPEQVQAARDLWEGWTPVYRRVTEWREPKPEKVLKLPRGVCSICGRERGLNGAGNLRAHDGLVRAPGMRHMEQCPGSRKPPREAVS